MILYENFALNCLTVSNPKLNNVFSNVLGKSSRSIIKHILEYPGETFDVPPFVDKRCKHSITEIQAAIDGAICHEQATKIKICLDFIDGQQKHTSKLDSKIFWLTKPYAAVLDLIRTVNSLSKEHLISTHTVRNRH